LSVDAQGAMKQSAAAGETFISDVREQATWKKISLP
jgi:hypothetical protein